jgi:putative NADH-flavin reductase
MNVLVIGGTRGLGRAVVTAAHGAGHTLTAMARHAADFSEATTGIRLVLGDAADATDIDRAVAGQHAVVWTVGVPATLRPVDVRSRGTQFLLDAMARHGVRRLVCVTGVGAGDDRGKRGFLHERVLKPLLRKSIDADRHRQETQVRGSGVDWTIVQPAALTSGPATGLYQTLTDAAPGAFKRISRADVADFIVANLAAPDYVHATVVLAG